ncbi:MAG: hypothetical protein ACT4PL_08390 [Phycisphaerales bacterium]
MSQLGMNLPGGASRRPQMTVYTGMLFIAVVSLATACVLMWTAASKIGPGGDAFAAHDLKKDQSIKFAK